MNLYTYKSRKVLKPIYKIAALLILIVLLLVAAKPILVSAARFLSMPTSNEKCDAIIIEGGPAFSEYFVTQALAAYFSGQAKKVILVLHAYDLKPTIFGISNYRAFVETAFDSLKIPRDDYQLLMFNVKDPYTYNSALALSDTLKDVQSLLIFSDNFHMRRSYLTFKKIFAKKNIPVYPYTMEIYLNATNWWTSANGWRRVITEYIKLTFYWFKGYV